jgi:hypothetical protein
MIVEVLTSVFVANLKAALLAASDDFTRPHLHCVRIELAKGGLRYVATNGHWVWIHEDVARVQSENGPEAFLLSVPDAKKVLRAIDTRKVARDVPVIVDTAARTIGQPGTPVSFVPVDATFPPYAHICPAESGVGERINASLSSDYIADVAAAFALVGGKGVIIAAGATDLDPVVFTSDHAPNALVILMPFRSNAKAIDTQRSALLTRYRTEVPAARKVA